MLDDDDDDGFGCAFSGLFLILGTGLIVVGWILLHLHQVKALVAATVGMVSVGILAREVIRRAPRRTPRAKLGAMPTPLASLEPGLVTAAGLVGFTEHARHAPLGAPPCIFYRVVVTASDHPDKILFESRSADAITLEDGAGAKVVVQLDGARWHMPRDHQREWPTIDGSEDVVQFLSERGVSVCEPARVRVEWIAPHELVFARGLARRLGEDAPSDYRTTREAHLEMAATPERPLEIGLEPFSAQ
ncbi:MAG TPA: hypothetical protein VGH28_28190 [Polyangiaceae bacterium]